MSLKDITITGSINSLPTLSYGQKTYIASTDEQSFPLETVIGGAGGSTPDLHGNVSSSNLFVNITQSWSGSINTPVGIVAFVDQTQNEFINGQYSGSDVLVTNGELSEDNPFLQFSTTIDYYTPILYYDLGPLSTSPSLNYINIPLGNFQNPATEPDNGEIYLLASITYSGIFSLGTNVTYAKISRYDSTGNDRSNVLQQLTDFRIKYSNNNIIQYDIVSLVNYGTYYLYSLVPKPLGNVAGSDFKYLDYTVSASNNSTLLIPADNSTTASFTSISVNPLNYLNASTFIYTPNNTPNLRLFFTASFTASCAEPSANKFQVAISLYPSFTPIVFYTASVNNSTSPVHFSFSSSFTPIENEQYVLSFYNPSINFNSASITNLEFNITQSTVSPQSGVLDTIIFNPDFEIDFFYNDWNALYGNEDGLEYDKDFMKVNYETGQTIPTNQQQILTGSAERAPVKPYNYVLKAQTLPRYEGVRTLQQNENVWTDGDIGFGTEPSVKLTETYFIYFSQIYDYSPIIKNTSAVNIRYLIDENGEIYTPNITNEFYYNLIDSFETNKKAYASLLQDNTSVFNSPQPIKYSGKFYIPVLYNLSSTFNNTATFATSINVVNPDGTNTGATDFGFYALAERDQYTGQQYSLKISTTEVTQNNNTLIKSDNKVNIYYYGTSSWDSSFDFQNGFTYGNPSVNWLTEPYYEFQSQPTSPQFYKVQIFPVKSNANNANATIKLSLYRTRSGVTTVLGTNNFIISSSYVGLSTDVGQLCELYIPNVFDNLQFDKLHAEVEVLSGDPILLNYNNTYPNVHPPTSLSNFFIWTADTTTPSPSTPFWTTGSSSRNILTSSYDLGRAILGNYFQENIAGSGFDPIEVSTSIYPNDEIRFDYNETNTFVIQQVVPSASSAVFLYLDREIPQYGVNINNFTIRRPTINANDGIILDTQLINNVNNGFLFPEYPSDKINKNLQSIIKNLNEKGLL